MTDGWSVVRQDWEAEGWTWAEAARWQCVVESDEYEPGDDDYVRANARFAATWRDAGFTPADFCDWQWVQGIAFTASNIRAWKNTGHISSTAQDFIRRAMTYGHHDDPSVFGTPRTGVLYDALEWAESRLPWDRVLACWRAGIALDEANRLPLDQQTDEALAVLNGLRGSDP